jgi:hypothetical protein
VISLTRHGITARSEAGKERGDIVGSTHALTDPIARGEIGEEARVIRVLRDVIDGE